MNLQYICVCFKCLFYPISSVEITRPKWGLAPHGPKMFVFFTMSTHPEASYHLNNQQ